MKMKLIAPSVVGLVALSFVAGCKGKPTAELPPGMMSRIEAAANKAEAAANQAEASARQAAEAAQRAEAAAQKADMRFSSGLRK
jgi:hypothetical protein